MKVFTVGYGGRTPENIIRILTKNGVRAVVDVRLRPDRASMGVWVKAKSADKGIEKLLGDHGISYVSLPELGNVFLDYSDWRDRYQKLLERAGDLLMDRLAGLPEPFCLLCSEKRASDCHRRPIAEYLSRTRSCEVEHLE